MDIEIKLATLEDIDSIYTIQVANIHPPLSKETIKEDFKKNNYIYVIAKNKDEVVGYITLSYVLEIADIISVAVKDGYKGKNIFSKMLNFIENILKENNVEEILLEVRESNSSAIKAYTKNNFKEISTRKNYYKDPVENAIIMKKII